MPGMNIVPDLSIIIRVLMADIFADDSVIVSYHYYIS